MFYISPISFLEFDCLWKNTMYVIPSGWAVQDYIGTNMIGFWPGFGRANIVIMMRSWSRSCMTDQDAWSGNTIIDMIRSQSDPCQNFQLGCALQNLKSSKNLLHLRYVLALWYRSINSNEKKKLNKSCTFSIKIYISDKNRNLVFHDDIVSY